MIPDLDLARVRKWIDQRNGDMPPHVHDQLRFEIDVTDRTITVLECRPPWREDFGSEWTRFPICRFRYTKVRKEWSLYWRDRNLKFHEYDLVDPTPHIDELIEEVKRDPTCIFWGWVGRTQTFRRPECPQPRSIPRPRTDSGLRFAGSR